MKTHLDAILLTQLDDTAINDRINIRRGMSTLLGVVFAAQPLHDVEVGGSVELNWVAVKEIGHHDKVAIGSELIGDELHVVELVADHVGDAVRWDGLGWCWVVICV